mmetsp:Transcript_11569/g.26374  ORF Transcript_11569/g.26374 Transcript_11569/m.26374 type:complete len:202 (+) Transcript_11569:1497-2102(+)
MEAPEVADVSVTCKGAMYEPPPGVNTTADVCSLKTADASALSVAPLLKALAFTVMVPVGVQTKGLAYTELCSVGSLPSVVNLMVALPVDTWSVMVMEEEWSPPAGVITGVPTCSLTVYPILVATLLSKKSVLYPIALTVHDPTGSVRPLLYCSEEPVGRVPSDVYRIMQSAVVLEIVMRSDPVADPPSGVKVGVATLLCTV